MGLWLKCPGCQENNPLAAQVCTACGRSLQNLPAQERIYVLGPAGAAISKPVPAPKPASPAAAEAAAPEVKKAKGPRKKKT